MQNNTVLLVCYHHGLCRDELAGLPVSSLTVVDEVVTLTMPMGATRPLFDLEKVYHQTLEAWYRLRRYEEPQEYLFGAILKDGRLSPYPITASYTELARFVFLADAGCHASTPERISCTLIGTAGHAMAAERC